MEWIFVFHNCLTIEEWMTKIGVIEIKLVMLGNVYPVMNTIEMKRFLVIGRIRDLYQRYETTKLREIEPKIYKSLVKYLDSLPSGQTNVLLIPTNVLDQSIIDLDAIKVFGTTMNYKLVRSRQIPIPSSSSRLPSSMKEVSDWITGILGKQKLK